MEIVGSPKSVTVLPKVLLTACRLCRKGLVRASACDDIKVISCVPRVLIRFTDGWRRKGMSASGDLKKAIPWGPVGPEAWEVSSALGEMTSPEI